MKFNLVIKLILTNMHKFLKYVTSLYSNCHRDLSLSAAKTAMQKLLKRLDISTSGVVQDSQLLSPFLGEIWERY